LLVQSLASPGVLPVTGKDLKT